MKARFAVYLCPFDFSGAILIDSYEDLAHCLSEGKEKTKNGYIGPQTLLLTGVRANQGQFHHTHCHHNNSVQLALRSLTCKGNSWGALV